ncbi:MAG: 30S ribosomal protein S8 [bacterium]
MCMTDPIANALTIIRNANLVKKEDVNIPYSKIKQEIIKILKNTGFIKEFELITMEDTQRKILKVYLKYNKKGEGVISGLKRISKPGLRRYFSWYKIPRILGGLGIFIVSTSRGIMTDKEAKNMKIGGEVLCSIW